MGNLLFGNELESYSTVMNSVEAAIQVSLGNVDYGSLIGASSTLPAAIYYYSFVFVIRSTVQGQGQEYGAAAAKWCTC